MTIAPRILSLHPELDARQREVVGHTVGPLLVIAGPGAGKTRCIELRAVNLLLTGQTVPGELVLCTFGKGAARELQQRFTISALACGVPADPSKVRISTIHSLCGRILARHAELVGLRRNCQFLDEGEQHRLLQQEFDAVFGPDLNILSGRGWRKGMDIVDEAARYFDRICDELIQPECLANSDRPFIAALGRCCLRYRKLLLERNLADFAHMQVWAHRVLQDSAVADREAGSVRHLLVDEFQDTSRVQMGILGMLAQVHGNIAAVGDDDQSIHRFRGASVANLLQFPQEYPGCRVIRLETNYRSHPAIVSACSRWMNGAADWSGGGGPVKSLRFGKNLAAHAPETHQDYPAVIAVQGGDDDEEGRGLCELLQFLKYHGVIASYGQVAVLLHSVMDGVSGPYLHSLADAGIGARCEPAGHAHAQAGDKVQVTTIHQAKGREWDVVVVGSLTARDLDTDRVGRNLAGFCGKSAAEPLDLVPEFDRVRRHYVAFTRARRLLVLTATGQPQERFGGIWGEATRWPDTGREALARQRFAPDDAGTPDLVLNIEHLRRLVIRVRHRPDAH